MQRIVPYLNGTSFGPRRLRNRTRRQTRGARRRPDPLRKKLARLIWKGGGPERKRLAHSLVAELQVIDARTVSLTFRLPRSVDETSDSRLQNGAEPAVAGSAMEPKG